MSFLRQRQMLDDMNYASDHRVRARDRERLPFDERAMTLTYEVEECECDVCVHTHYAPFSCGPTNTRSFQGPEGSGYFKLWYNYYEVRHTHSGCLVTQFLNDPRQEGENAARELTKSLNEASGWNPSEREHVHSYVFPAKFDVCDTCEGRGSHVNPSIDASGIGQDDEFWDDDYDDQGDDDEPNGHSRYMRGDYDVQCYGCSGKRVVPVIDRDSLNDEQLEALKRYDDHLRDMEEDAAERMAELRFGC